MYCKKCGAQQDDNNHKCTGCGEILAPSAQQVKIPNYLVQSILVTLLCCLPCGVAAIVYAAQVNGKIQAGDIQGALDASGKAKMWSWISFGIGLAGTIIYLGVLILGGIARQS
jgi:hypothetical protein